MTYNQVIDGIDFSFIAKRMMAVTKIMSTLGTVNEVQSHATLLMVRGEHITFNYAESHSGHNKTKHWVDDHNNSRYDPIDMAETWRTKW